MNEKKYHTIFDNCVTLLQWGAEIINPYWKMDYVKINVILFCFILPAVLAGSIGTNIVLLRLLMRAAAR
jgi:hypothetical protein